MPRFLPKLIQSVKITQKGRELKAPESNSFRSGGRRRPPPTALPYPSFSPHGRKQSILLDDVNPIMHHDAFTQHKLNAPIVPSVVGRGKRAKRQAREMTDRECEWWSNPYSEMTVVLGCNYDWHLHQPSQNVSVPSSSVHCHGKAITCRSGQSVSASVPL
jgi:hypothetical protein